jgi:hypothetical protein
MGNSCVLNRTVTQSRNSTSSGLGGVGGGVRDEHFLGVTVKGTDEQDYKLILIIKCYIKLEA